MLQLLMQQLAPSHSPLCRAHAAHHRPTLLAARAAIHHLLLMHTSTSSHNKFKRARYAAAAAAAADPGSNGETHQHQHAASTTTTTATIATPARPKVVIITGPTAVGKTKLGLELAKRLGGEIISADSVQVYRGLDVGSDKLPAEQREGVPHHLIDILEPEAEFSAGDFHSLGRTAAADILSRCKVPIVAGGTGFYLRWFVHGKPTTPPSSPEAAAKALELIGQAWVTAAAEVAAAQQQQQQQQQQGDGVSGGQSSDTRPAAAAATAGEADDTAADAVPSQAGQQQQSQLRWPNPSQPQAGSGSAVAAATTTATAAAAAADTAELAALSRFLSVTPAAAAAAAQLQPQQRWDVAVDVVQQLGDAEAAARIRAERNNWYRLQRVLQILIINGGKPLSELDIDTTKELDYDFRCFFLHRPRLELFERIIHRVEEMVAGGLLSEALMLLDRGMQANTNIATRAIGYRQALDFLQAALAKGSATPQELQQLIFDISTASRNLVKNQTTWFRDDQMFKWVEVSGRSTEEVLEEVLLELDRPQHQGGCGDSGRFDKAAQTALKRYVPRLKLYSDPGRVVSTLKWVEEAAAARTKQQQGGGAVVDAAAAPPTAAAAAAVPPVGPPLGDGQK